MFPVDKRLDAVTNFLVLGNLRQVSAITGVGYQTIKQWRQSSWWKDMEAEIVASRRIATGSKLRTIVDKSLDVIDDRLTNGEMVLNNKTGEITRRDVSLRDATTAANALMQREAIIEKMTRDETVAESSQTIAEQLKGLAAEFAKFNNRHKTEAIDVEYIDAKATDEERVDAVYDEREEGLQEGSEELYIQTGSSEEADGTERSTPGNGEGGEGS